MSTELVKIPCTSPTGKHKWKKAYESSQPNCMVCGYPWADQERYNFLKNRQAIEEKQARKFTIALERILAATKGADRLTITLHDHCDFELCAFNGHTFIKRYFDHVHGVHLRSEIMAVAKNLGV